MRRLCFPSDASTLALLSRAVRVLTCPYLTFTRAALVPVRRAVQSLPKAGKAGKASLHLDQVCAVLE